ncbi:DUF5988 family protein [Streptomyces sp. NPDC001480]|uniref:DUF5988 family protein n=1 Tax=Streptomyces sp. NPDC001480 TaxID=3364577 RepID=UPI0036CD988F
MGYGSANAAAVLGRVRLEGGPRDLSGAVDLDDMDMVLSSPEKIKIRYLGGYEHYEYVEELPGDGLPDDGSGPLLRWSGRTKIAE